MDFDKTSFSVDWFTPGDKYCPPKRLSFPKSARISIDDFVSDSPLSICFSPVGEVLSGPLAYSFAEASGWTNSAPSSPFSPPDPEAYPMYDRDADVNAPDESVVTETDTETVTHAGPLASSGLLSIASECAACGVDVDLSCLDDLDEQLLLCPMASFTEICWAAAVRDETNATGTASSLPPPPHVMHRSMRSRARSFKYDDRAAFRPPEVESPPYYPPYPSSFERTRPLAAKITLPLDTFPHAQYRSPFSDSHDTLPTFQEEKKPRAYILYTDPDGRPPPHSSLDAPRRSEPRKLGQLMLTPSLDSLALASQLEPGSPYLKPSKSTQPLRVFSDAYATFTRGRRKSPH